MSPIHKPFLSLRWKAVLVFVPTLLLVFGLIGWRVHHHLSLLPTDSAHAAADYELALLASAGLLSLLLCLMLISWPSLMRLRRQAELLPLLGKKQFRQVREKVVIHQRRFGYDDELDRLGSSSIDLSMQLESLEKAVDQHTSELERISLYDALTGLANRNLFQYEVQREADKQTDSDQLSAVFLLDLDKFKRFNDSLGHHVGDQLLSTIGDRLKRNSKPLGVIARLGGDEFAILCRDIKRPSQAEKLAKKIGALISSPIEIEGANHVITSSIGIALLEGSTSANDLIRNAEIAMYKAKEKPGNSQQRFNNPMATEAYDKLSLEEEIRRAFRDKEFTLYLQPKVNMGEKTEGFEALIRWDHPDRGILAPGEFIPAMETMGFIAEMDHLVLDASCRQLKVWKQLYPDISLAVNISSNHLASPKFFEFLKACLEKYSINPDKLELEITETLLMDNLSSALKALHNIKKLGVRIAIDDFGTGYSSLSYLKTLPIDTLKIDREFIKEIPDNERDMQISSVIIYLAKQLGFKVVAEGVETIEQLVFLKTNQCDLAQGYYFSKPIPAHKAIIMLEYERNNSASNEPEHTPRQAEVSRFLDN